MMAAQTPHRGTAMGVAWTGAVSDKKSENRMPLGTGRQAVGYLSILLSLSLSSAAVAALSTYDLTPA